MRIRSPELNIKKRAKAIADNMRNVHNSNYQTVLLKGAAIHANTFLSEAIDIATKEEESNTIIYKLVKNLPRKVMPRIHEEITLKHAILSEQLLNGSIDIVSFKKEIGLTAITSRYGEGKVTPEMIFELNQFISLKFKKNKLIAA
jgi:hypothetical protein